MNAKELVDSLFAGYEETAALTDFKEELLGNLNAKIESLMKKGMDAQAAFAKASAELGDVSMFADELSLKKRKEVFEEVYMDIKAYMSGGRVAAYVIFGVVALLGITAACITLFATRRMENLDHIITYATGGIGLPGNIDFTAFFGTMMPFLTAAVIGFTYLGVTQETVSMYPMSKKRGAWYAVAAGLIAFGLCTMPIVYFGSRIAREVVNEFDGITFADFDHLMTIIPVISLIIPFILPGIGILVYLILTEKNRLKPWVKEYSDKLTKQIIENSQNPFPFSDGAAANRFGLFSGAIWIFAIGLFVLLGFLIGFKFSWLVFIFATAFQLVVQGVMSRKDK